MNQIKKSFHPIEAPKNYKNLDSLLKIDEDVFQTYVGSGIRLQDHPLFQSLGHWIGGNGQCGHCKSMNTLCIYFTYSSAHISRRAAYEVVCQDCFEYTLYIETD